MSYALLQQDNLEISKSPLPVDPKKIVNYWNSFISLQLFQLLGSLNTQQSKKWRDLRFRIASVLYL